MAASLRLLSTLEFVCVSVGHCVAMDTFRRDICSLLSPVVREVKVPGGRLRIIITVDSRKLIFQNLVPIDTYECGLHLVWVDIPVTVSRAV